MPSALEEKIRQYVLSVAEQRLSLDDFQRWFVPLSWDIERSGDDVAIALVHEIDGILAESSSARWPQADLRTELANAVRPLEEIPH